MLATFDLAWPPFVVAFFQTITAVNLSVDIFQPECAIANGEVTFFVVWIMKLSVPLVFGLIFLAAYGVVWSYAKCRYRFVVGGCVRAAFGVCGRVGDYAPMWFPRASLCRRLTQCLSFRANASPPLSPLFQCTG